MPLDPDTEIQYRKGGKVKQKPKKFASGGFMNWVLGKKEEPKKAEPKEELKKEEPKKFEGILKQGDTLSNPFKKMIENAGSPPPEKKAKGGSVKKPKKFDAGGVAEMAAGLAQAAQGMQRPSGMGRMFGARNKAAKMEKMRMGMGGGAPGGGMRQGLGGLFGRRKAMQAAAQPAPQPAPQAASYQDVGGVTGGKKGGKVSNAKIGEGKGSKMKESKAMMGKELSFMKKKGAPKSMIKHEAAEMGAMKPKKYARGGGIEIKGKTRGKMC